jgi:hypothetical protein
MDDTLFTNNAARRCTVALHPPNPIRRQTHQICLDCGSVAEEYYKPCWNCTSSNWSTTSNLLKPPNKQITPLKNPSKI